MIFRRERGNKKNVLCVTRNRSVQKIQCYAIETSRSSSEANFEKPRDTIIFLSYCYSQEVAFTAAFACLSSLSRRSMVF